MWLLHYNNAENVKLHFSLCDFSEIPKPTISSWDRIFFLLNFKDDSQLCYKIYNTMIWYTIVFYAICV